jgi:hypothetical protein
MGCGAESPYSGTVESGSEAPETAESAKEGEGK